MNRNEAHRDKHRDTPRTDSQLNETRGNEIRVTPTRRGSRAQTDGSPEQVYLRQQSRVVRRRVGSSLQDLWAAARGAADPRELVRRHPWMTAGAVLAGGFALVAAARRFRPVGPVEAHPEADRGPARLGLMSEAARAARGVLLTALMSRLVAAPCDEAADAARASDGMLAGAGGDVVEPEGLPDDPLPGRA